MPWHRPYHILAVLFCLLCSACGDTTTSTGATAPPAPMPTTDVTPPAAPPTVAATAISVPTVTSVPTTTPMPTTSPTVPPTPTTAPAVISALYPCDSGLCRYTQGDEEAEELITALNPGLHGYAFRPDGAGLILAQETYPDSDIEILLMDSDMGNTRSLATIEGLPSGAGGLEGASVIGMTADGERVLFEDRAQLLIANIDGGERRAVMDPRPYGATSTHAYTPSPSGLRVLYTRSNNPNYFEIADVETAQVRSFSLPADRRALALIDDSHVLVERFEPPVDLEGSNPAGAYRFSLGYEVVPIEGAALGEPATLLADDGSFARSVISNVAGDWLLISDDYPRTGDDAPERPDPLWLLNVKTGERQPISLPLYDDYSRVAIAVGYD